MAWRSRIGIGRRATRCDSAVPDSMLADLSNRGCETWTTWTRFSRGRWDGRRSGGSLLRCNLSHPRHHRVTLRAHWSSGLKVGALTVHAIQAGGQRLDGGAIVGVVPKPLWEKDWPPTRGTGSHSACGACYRARSGLSSSTPAPATRKTRISRHLRHRTEGAGNEKAPSRTGHA